MAFPVLEESTFSGSPIQFYDFQREDFHWRYNTSDRDITYNSNLYKAVPISDEGITLSGEAAATDFNVTLPVTAEFYASFRLSGTVPSDTIYLRVRRGHAADITGIDGATPVISDTRLVWIGTVNGVTQLDDIRAKVTCAMLSTSFRRGGLRYGYQRNCPHVLYAANTCKVDRESFKLIGILTSVVGTTLKAVNFAAAPEDGWLKGGFIEYPLDSGFTERRMILRHTGDTIHILGFPLDLVVGSVVTAFAGCDRTVNTCLNKFNNLDNMGGFPHSPGRSPYDGKPVF